MKKYDPKRIEKKWQAIWERKKLNVAQGNSRKKKYYLLVEFPYPSGDGLHTGHIRSYTALDVLARKRRAEGYNVLYPMGWDAFGLPTENYAIKTGVHPKIVTKKNTDNFRRQLKSLGFSFDWTREVNTSDPAYYKWTQWIFLQLLKEGLAYKAKRPINWCLNCKIGLADEEVVDGKCERCGGETEKRDKEQWMLAITKYGDRLDKDLDGVHFLEKIKIQQRNWIGRSEGAEIDFQLSTNNKQQTTEKITVFTTRPDTLFGATYVVLAPEHPLVQILSKKISNKKEVDLYVKTAAKKTEIERTSEGKKKTGVELKGIKAINPGTKEEIPVFIGDHVLFQYGTGAIMAVPAHDERDFEFAKMFKVPMRQVVAPVLRRTTGNDAVKPDVEFKERNAVMCIVKHWEKEEYLSLQWNEFPEIRSFISGGIEQGENPVEAGLREIKEESGFVHANFVRQVGQDNFTEFYHQLKKINVRAHFKYLYFELVDGKQIPIAEKEQKIHTIHWKKKNEVLNFISNLEKESVWRNFLGEEKSYGGDGLIIDSGKFNGLTNEEAKKKIVEFVGGKIKVTFKLRDWVFSRQRYWGEPIPVVHCEKCGVVPVPEKDLPVELPNVKSYKPTDTGESPLSKITSWVNVTCPKCGGKAKRETDVMPNWAGSSWYFLRYADPKNKKAFASKLALKYWVPVDWYNGGMEHTTLHLLYSRFWHKFLYDQKLVPTKEPYVKRTSHGLILAEGGVKMSKSKGNTVSPDSIVKLLGADTLRHYEMFMGPFDQSIAWNGDAISGSRRFIERIFKMFERVEKGKENKKSFLNKNIETLLHQTIKKVGEDIEELKMNTALSQMMILLNSLEKETVIPKSFYATFLRILAPFIPHVAEELWEMLNEKSSIHLEPWPKFDSKKLTSGIMTIPIQVNGKMKTSITVSSDLSDEQVEGNALANPTILRLIMGKSVKRIIYIKKKIINIVM